MGPVALAAQTVFFHFTNGTTLSYYVDEVRKLTFEGDQQVLWLNDETQYEWNVSTIGHYDFDQTVGVAHIASGTQPIPLRLYPNPSDGHVTIEFGLDQPDRIVIEVHDIQGKLVRPLGNREWPSGNQQLTWDGLDEQGARVAAGTYMVRIRSAANSTTRQVVMQ